MLRSVISVHIVIINCIWPIILGLPDPLNAQWVMGGKAVAMGKTGTAWPDDDWAVFHNPALIDVENRHFGVFAIRYFGLRELEDHAAAITIPVSLPLFDDKMDYGFASGIHSYGFELFRETQMRMGVSIRRNRLRIGVVLRYIHQQISGYGSTGIPTMDAGVAAELTHGFRIGYRINHLPGDKNKQNEIGNHPEEMAIGVSWDGTDRLLLTSELVKDVLYPISVRTAMEWEGMDDFFLRVGWTTKPLTWSMGCGLKISHISINMAVQKHPVLGLSPGIDSTISF